MSNAPVLVPVLKCHGVTREFCAGDARVSALKGVDIIVNPGELLALMGPSGSGKSTFLQIMGLLDTPTEGKLFILGNAAHDANDRERTALRNRYIGFVYQFHHLLPELNAVENAMMPLLIAGKTSRVARARAEGLLDRLGLKDRLRHRPGQLSGGEQQRVAIARALANHPRLLLADEPTGNLDSYTAKSVCDYLLQIAREEGVAAIIATHNPELASRLTRTIRMDSGVLKDSAA